MPVDFTHTGTPCSTREEALRAALHCDFGGLRAYLVDSDDPAGQGHKFGLNPVLGLEHAHPQFALTYL